MRITISTGLTFTLALVACVARNAAADESAAAIVVKPIAESPTSGIQEAIDALGSEGGSVTIAAGEYSLRQSIRLRDNVTLQGVGEATVLRKNKQFGSKLTALNVGKTLLVHDASGFQPGDEIGVFDRTSVGWLHGHAVIVEVKGKELLLSKNPGGKFDPANGAAAINYFPAISGRDVSRVVVKDLVIDGQRFSRRRSLRRQRVR
jgi:hypothetical protein